MAAGCCGVVAKSVRGVWLVGRSLCRVFFGTCNGTTDGTRTFREPPRPVAHLTAFFGCDARAAALTTYQIRQYQLARRAAGAANGTINRDTSALHRMCTLSGSRPRARRRWWGEFSPFRNRLPRPWRADGRAATPTARCLPPRRHPRPPLAHGVAHRLSGGRRADPLPSRLPPHRRPQPDPRHLRPLQHHQRTGTARQGLRRHATLPQSWIQRENWECETYRRPYVWRRKTSERRGRGWVSRRARQRDGRVSPRPGTGRSRRAVSRIVKTACAS